MSLVVMDGKALAQKIRADVRHKIELNKIQPTLAVIQIGDDKASSIYVRNKSKACEEVGIQFIDYHLDKDITWAEACAMVDELNEDDKVDGILIQQPVPEHLKGIEQLVTPDKDVDGFTHVNLGKLVCGEPTFIACTPKGILKLLEEYNISTKGKHIVIIGRSNIVGKPAALSLLAKDATVTICHSKTAGLKYITQTADILIVAIGKSKFIDASYISPDCQCVIDVGINRDENNKICGDLDYESFVNKWSNSITTKYITPVPGGVGPLTIACLLENVLDAALMGRFC